MKRIIPSLLGSLIAIAPHLPARAQLVPLTLDTRYQDSNNFFTFTVVMPTDNMFNRPYGGQMTYFDVAVAQSYGITYDICNWETPDENGVTYRFTYYTQQVEGTRIERSHVLSCGRARQLAAIYKTIPNARPIKGDYAIRRGSTLNLNTPAKVTSFKRIVNSFGPGN